MMHIVRPQTGVSHTQKEVPGYKKHLNMFPLQQERNKRETAPW
jgi:hypothetical protein